MEELANCLFAIIDKFVTILKISYTTDIYKVSPNYNGVKLKLTTKKHIETCLPEQKY